jgi:hypothetical protein
MFNLALKRTSDENILYGAETVLTCNLRWSPSVGQVRGLIKRESCHSHGVWYH